MFDACCTACHATGARTVSKQKRLQSKATRVHCTCHILFLRQISDFVLCITLILCSTSLQCLKVLAKTSREGTEQVCLTCRSDLFSPNTNHKCYAVHIDGDQTQSATDQQSRDGPSFGDSSGPFFSMYSNAAEEEDNKMVKRWQKDADGILIFVSPCVRIYMILCTNLNRNTRLVYSLPQLLRS